MSRHIVVVNRWHDAYARYADYFDHGRDRVSYVVTPLGLAGAPLHRAATHRVVGATDDAASVLRAVADIQAEVGPITRIVALNEGDLDVAARVREALSITGMRESRLRLFRDKLAMLECAGRSAVPVPPFAAVRSPSDVLRFGRANGWPVVVKPRRGTASRGVVVLRAPAEVRALRLTDEPHLVQVFRADPVVHVDGVWMGDRLGPWRASRYVNSCSGFTDGSGLGSVEIDDAAVLDAVGGFTGAACAAFDRRPWVFHMELFCADGPGGPRLEFLEVGRRAGGAEIPFVWREVHGIDLMGLAARIDTGPVPEVASSTGTRIAGWAVVPVAARRPCVVDEVTVGEHQGEAEQYAAVLPEIGQVIPDVGGYEHVGGRFRFRGPSSAAVTAAVVATLRDYRVSCRPADAVPRVAAR